MSPKNRKLPPKKSRAIAALLEHPTIAAAAVAAGVGERTLARWLAEDRQFKKALAEAQTRALDQTISRLSGGGPHAVEVLIEIASNEYNSSAVRVQAASKILSEQRAGLNLITLKNEIEELKRIANELEERDQTP